MSDLGKNGDLDLWPFYGASSFLRRFKFTY